MTIKDNKCYVACPRCKDTYVAVKWEFFLSKMVHEFFCQGCDIPNDEDNNKENISPSPPPPPLEEMPNLDLPSLNKRAREEEEEDPQQPPKKIWRVVIGEDF